MRQLLSFYLLTALTSALFGVCTATAQNKKYVSRVDAGLSIKSVVLVPLIDNVNGIYAGPLTEELNKIISNDRQWNLISSPDLKAENPDILEESQKRSQEVIKKYKSDALVSGRILKNEKGITLKLTLIGGEEAWPLVNETLENHQGFETQDLKSQIGRVFANLKNRLPFQATVTSRQGQLVTVNVGKIHGAREGEELLPVLITKIDRHPKFKFITSSEREILGKIRLSKVDDSVSFGSVTSELTANLIQPGFKIARDQFLNYPGVSANNGKVLTPLDQRPDHVVAFGDNPKEWTPIQRGSFGKLSFLLGITQASMETSHNDGRFITSSSNYVPTAKVDGEIWIDPNWQISLELEQLTSRFKNASGSVPSIVSFQMQQVRGLGAYNFLADGEFFGPKFHLMAGFGKLSTFIDDTAPQLHSSKSYSALSFGLAGSLPFELENKRRLTVGGRFLYHVSPTLEESPNSGASSSNMYSDFMIYGEYGWTERMSFRGDLEFKQLGSSFSGGTSSSSSMNFVSILAGIGYNF